MRDQSGTRARIQTVALELFTEQGYDATSLREIAERLGVTKAALYYHFKTKEDIIASVVEDRIEVMDELIAWARSQEDPIEMRRELLHRYADELSRDQQHKAMRFMDRNQTSLKHHPQLALMRERMMTIVGLLSSPEDPLPTRLRHGLALFALHVGWFLFRDELAEDDEKRHAAALQVALELID
jgi:AcrR family transcriptional regulator